MEQIGFRKQIMISLGPDGKLDFPPRSRLSFSIAENEITTLTKGRSVG